MISATTGTLVAVEARSYNAFTDARGETRPGGTSYRLHLAPSFDAAPLEVRCDEATYNTAKSLGQGANVEVLVEIGASNNRVRYTAKGLQLVSKNGAQVKA